MMPRTTMAMLLAVALTGCAARTPTDPAAPGAGDCFDTTRVAGWESAGSSRIRVRTHGRDAFELSLQGPQCVDVAWSPSVAIESGTGSPRVCVGEGVGLGEVHFQDGPGGREVTCRIASVSRAGSASAAP
jgi:hypothetical protein